MATCPMGGRTPSLNAGDVQPRFRIAARQSTRCQEFHDIHSKKAVLPAHWHLVGEGADSSLKVAFDASKWASRGCAVQRVYPDEAADDFRKGVYRRYMEVGRVSISSPVCMHQLKRGVLISFSFCFLILVSMCGR